VLDLGCGLGYLTYALVKDGFAATGCDVSGVAIAEATRAFGPHYSCEDLEALSLRKPGAYDAVVLAEVIEHVDDVHTLLATVSTLLRPGGEMIVTTPNRSNWGECAIWHTELPPLHLWWFSEQSLRWLASRLGCEISFTDFSEFNRRCYQTYNPQRVGDAASSRPVFAADGRLLARPSSLATEAYEAGRVVVRKASRAFGVLGAYRRVRDAIVRNERYDTRSYSMCAVLRKASP
jgi:SAM-dependent methyltransferase